VIQNWKKIGITKGLPKHYSHFTVPFSEHLYDDIFRIFFSPRDENNKSFITYLDFDVLKNEIVKTYEDRILQPGDLGSFDDSGVVLFQILNTKTGRFLYYSGWMLGVTVPFYFWVGLTIAKINSNNFSKRFNAPILPVSEVDPYLTGASWVIEEGNMFKMWYISGIKWEDNNGHIKHYYTVKYAYSYNGIDWIRENKICINFKSEYEYAIARPVVLKEEGLYKMWYSYRAGIDVQTYRIGYAESYDGIDWVRKDAEVNLSVSENGWDSEMICYSFVFDHKGERYMLYNGNDYGKTGFGLAILEK
jgi:hypothetical protein